MRLIDSILKYNKKELNLHNQAYIWSYIEGNEQNTTSFKFCLSETENKNDSN